MKRNLVLIGLVFVLAGCSLFQPKDPEKPPVVEPQFKTLSVSVDGSTYQMPFPYKTLLDDGWKEQVSETLSIEPHTYITKRYLRRNKQMIEVSLYNPTDVVISQLEAYVSLIGGEDRTSLYDDVSNLTLNKGLNLESTLEDFEAAFGRPTSVESSRLNDHYTFEIDALQTVTIWIVKETQALRWLYVESFRISE